MNNTLSKCHLARRGTSAEHLHWSGTALALCALLTTDPAALIIPKGERGRTDGVPSARRRPSTFGAPRESHPSVEPRARAQLVRGCNLSGTHRVCRECEKVSSVYILARVCVRASAAGPQVTIFLINCCNSG